jgi:hypothetical protein
MNLMEDGLGSIIYTIMVPESTRIEFHSIQLLYEIMMVLSIAHPNFEKVKNDN